MRQPLGVSRLRRWRSRDSWTPVATVGQSSRRLVVVAVAATLLCGLLYAVSVLTPTGQVVADLILYGGTVTDPRIQAAAWGTLGVITAGMLAGSTLGLAGLALAPGRPHALPEDRCRRRVDAPHRTPSATGLTARRAYRGLRAGSASVDCAQPSEHVPRAAIPLLGGLVDRGNGI